MTRPAPHIAAMAPYALSRMPPPPGVPLLSLSQNESLRAPSPAAVAAGARAFADAALYPDPDWTQLRRLLGDVHGLDAGAILCGAGSLDLIGALMRVYAGPGRAVLVPAHAYPFFGAAARMVGARVDPAPERDFTVSVDALLQAIRPDTAILCLANPGNPTGTRISRSGLDRLRAALPPQVLLVIDEAYGEFADHLEAPAFGLTSAGNTVVLRTFSKAYGLAGARVGWGLFPPNVATQLRKVLNPNGVCAAGQAAAYAALEDADYVAETVRLTASAREAAAGRLRAAGLQVVPGLTNFLLLPFRDAATASRIDAGLRAAGVFLRVQSGAGLPHALRMTIGPPDVTEAALTRIIAEAAP